MSSTATPSTCATIPAGVRAAGERALREPAALAVLGAGAVLGTGLFAVAGHLRRRNLLDVRDLHMRICELALDDDELMEVFPPIHGVDPTRQDLYCNIVVYLQKIAREIGAIGRAEQRAVLRYWMTSVPMREFWEQVRDPRRTIIGSDRRERRFQRLVDQAYAAVEPAHQESAPDHTSAPPPATSPATPPCAPPSAGPICGAPTSPDPQDT